jgi:hypothetical protein
MYHSNPPEQHASRQREHDPESAQRLSEKIRLKKKLKRDSTENHRALAS